MFLLILLVSFTALAQPDWVLECPKGIYRDFYFCGFSIDRDYNLALAKAFNMAVLKIQREYSIFVDVKVEKSPSIDKSLLIVNLRGKEQKMEIRLVDTYHIKVEDHFKVWVLIAVPKPAWLAKREPSDFEAMIRSAIFPGWGQLLKGREDRAIFFIVAEAISTGLTVYFFSVPNKTARYYGKIFLWVTLGIHLVNIIDSATISNKMR